MTHDVSQITNVNDLSASPSLAKYSYGARLPQLTHHLRDKITGGTHAGAYDGRQPQYSGLDGTSMILQELFAKNLAACVPSLRATLCLLAQVDLVGCAIGHI